MWDFERAEGLTNAELAALRFARDAGRLPSLLTAGHIEELRRYYNDREIQELFASVTSAAYLSSVMQSQRTVTDEESAAWTEQNIPQWSRSLHRLHGEGNDIQRPYHMGSFFAAIQGAIIGNGGSIEGVNPESMWVGEEVFLGIDSDGDAVADAYDGFPNDPIRWADVDGDGIENRDDPDTDGDGLSDEEEMALGTSLVRADSDNDGISDPKEISIGTDPWVKN